MTPGAKYGFLSRCTKQTTLYILTLTLQKAIGCSMLPFFSAFSAGGNWLVIGAMEHDYNTYTRTN